MVGSKINNYKQAIESIAIIPRGYTINVKLIATKNWMKVVKKITLLATFIPCNVCKGKKISHLGIE